MNIVFFSEKDLFTFNEWNEFDGITMLFRASTEGNLELVRLLVEGGADKDKATREGWTPLNYASNGGHLEMVRLLIEKGANLDKAT